jgi:membrane-bound serine protease (ClpP class)
MEFSLGLAYALIGLGFLLMVAELFLPTGGILWVLSVVAFALGVTMTFLPPEGNATIGMLTLLGLFVAVPLVSNLLLHYWPKTPFGRKLFLQNPEAETTATSTPEHQEMERLVGRFGKTVSALRPAGVANFDGRRVDCMTEGMMVDPEHWVQCIGVRAGTVIVRPVEKPDVSNLETADFS